MAMMWLNQSVTTINATLDIYIYIYIWLNQIYIYIYIDSLLKVPQKKAKRKTK